MNLGVWGRLWNYLGAFGITFGTCKLKSI